MEYIAVIGANYGDEGKGRVVNWLSDENTLVTRYSGSAQAAHTVVDNGRRHVFKHFGSGTLRGAETFLSESFLTHPIIFLQEMRELEEFAQDDDKIDPFVNVDSRSLVVLPTDMIINQFLEKVRGHDRHGSCGAGVRQAQERAVFPALRTEIGDLVVLLDNGMLRPLMEQHFHGWCGMNGHTPQEVLRTVGIKSFDGVMDKFVNDCWEFLRYVEIAEEDDAYLPESIAEVDRMILEGSQGLALDPGIGQLPYLTPSHVGVGGLASFFRYHTALTPKHLELVYVTRPYLTRHGAGPLPREEEWGDVTDETNVSNQWQGSLRTAPINLHDVAKRILRDREWMNLWYGRPPELRVSLAVTCLDQVEGEAFRFYDLNKEVAHGEQQFRKECETLLRCVSNGGELSKRLILCRGDDPEKTSSREMTSESAGLSATAMEVVA